MCQELSFPFLFFPVSTWGGGGRKGSPKLKGTVWATWKWRPEARTGPAWGTQQLTEAPVGACPAPPLHVCPGGLILLHPLSGLQGFYEEVANPLLTDVEVEYPKNAIQDLTQNTYQHFYDGSEIVVAGRLADEDINNFKADVKGYGVSWSGA